MHFFSSAETLPASKQHAFRERITELDRTLTTVKSISQADLSADGLMVAWSAEGVKADSQSIKIARVDNPKPVLHVTAAESDADCQDQSPVWSPDGRRLAFLSDCRSPGQLQLYITDLHPADSGTALKARQLTHVTGSVALPEWSPDGTKIAFLLVNNAPRTPSPMAAIKAPTGVIDEQETTEIQRVAITDIGSGETRELTPANLYAFEFDWSPDSRTLAFTAAPPPGDDNWYVAKLYTEPIAAHEPRCVYQPALQIALPRWSPDGKSIAFISGLMSDEGLTGGEIYVVPAAGGKAKDLTPGRSSTPSWFTWTSSQSLLFTEYRGGSSAISKLDVVSGKTATLWEGGETIHAWPQKASLSVAYTKRSVTPVVALVRSSWSLPPEVWAGPVGNWRQISRENSKIDLGSTRVEDIAWKNDSFQVQGWLLFPDNFDPAKLYPMIVSVHGGPAWIFTPSWAAAHFDAKAFSNFGYFVFFPNPRGSFGQGERFTQANRRDWGFGDLSDITTGIDAVLAKEPVGRDRVGITGWSYGGSTAMFAVTRTNRFRAAVAGAAACNLQSYYGENSIDQWMLPYFGASVYDDPVAYARSSALTYVKDAKTPTLIVVGERDGEAPPAQSFEFWHALKTMHVPTQLVVYAGEGHGFVKQADRIDLIERSLEWFARFMPPQRNTESQ